MKCILKDFPKLLVSSEIMKVNRAVAYMSFLLKDIWDFSDTKGPDGTNLTLVRNSNFECERWKKELEKIEWSLESTK